jgi:hypothetical protein
MTNEFKEQIRRAVAETMAKGEPETEAIPKSADEKTK